MLQRFLLATALAASGLIGISADAKAADMPIKAPPRAIVGEYGASYVWTDDSYQSIGLPGVQLGWRHLNSPAFTPGDFRETYNPRASGVGVSGAIGYVFRDGTFAPAFGSNARIEIGASYVKASVSQSASGTPDIFDVLQLLDGTIAHTAGSAPGRSRSNSTLTTDYTAWRINSKAATDYRHGALTITPSWTLFGGQTRNRQDFAQSFFEATFATTSNYTAASSLRWTDLGAKLGLDGKVDVTDWLALGLGGTAGIAARNVFLGPTIDTSRRCSGRSCRRAPLPPPSTPLRLSPTWRPA